MTNSGFISVVGRPNVGKSTLVNTLVGEKVAITSSRPQTTRNTIRGVVTRPPTQFVFVDTPGLHRPRTALGERLNKLVYGSLADNDMAVFLIDATQPVGPGDRLIAERLTESGAPTVVVVNKVDVATPSEIADQLARAGEWDFAAYVPLSAKEGAGCETLLDELEARVPEGPWMFPADVRTDQPEALLVSELIREKFLDRLREELPHSLAVVPGEIETRSSGTVYVPATIYVERESQKGMVIGKGGDLIGRAGAEARRDLEVLFGAPVYLDLRVKVERDWQRKEALLDRMGY